MSFLQKIKNIFKKGSKKIKNIESKNSILNEDKFQLSNFLDENNEITINKDEIFDETKITKLSIEKIISKNESLVKFTNDLAKDFSDFLSDKKEFNYEKNLKILNFFLNTNIIEQNPYLDRKFKELLMIYFFEKAIIFKKIHNITVPLFDNIDINWSGDWKQENQNMSVCFDFNHKFGNNFKLCTMRECSDYAINKIQGNFCESKENLNYLIARAKMTENFLDIWKETKNINSNHLIGLLGEYFVVNKLLYGKPAKNIRNSSNFYNEDYIPENLEYLERICSGFDKDKYLYRKKEEENIKDKFYLKPDIFKLLWMRNKDQFFSDSDFIISYPIYYSDSTKLKGYCIKLVEVKSTKNFYLHLPKKYFDYWLTDNKNKYWKDSFKLSIKEFYKLKNNEDYILLRVYGINYDFSNIKNSDLKNENNLKNLKIKFQTSNEKNLNKNQKVVVIKLERYYILRQIFEFFKNIDLFINDDNY